MPSILEQAGGSFNQRKETCRLRRHRPRPRQQIGTATIGRREVGIPGILHGLTHRDFSQFLRPVSVGREINFPDLRREVWTEHSHDMFEHVQFIRTVCFRAHSLTTRSRVAPGCTAQGLRIGVLK